MPPVRTRLAVALTSLAIICLELALMRSMSIRFWHHLAYMIIGVALLGFGASGTMATLLRKQIQANSRLWLCGLAMAFSISVPVTHMLSRYVPLEMEQLAWNLGHVVNILALELLMFVPFFLAAGVITVAMMDRADRLSGHYAASLLGSGIGAGLTIALMKVLGPTDVILAAAAMGLLAGVIVLLWRKLWAVFLAVITAGVFFMLVCLMSREQIISQYKMLPIVRSMAGAKVIHHSEGPLAVRGESRAA